jgi:hypothetical protein
LNIPDFCLIGVFGKPVYPSSFAEWYGDFTSTDMAGEVSGDQPARHVSQAEPIWTTKGVEGEVSMNSPPEMGK